MVNSLSNHKRKALQEPWLALVIGNTRLHWGFFNRDQLVGVWHTSHLTAERAEQLVCRKFVADAWQKIAEQVVELKKESLPKQATLPSAVWIASVVPKQTEIWVTALALSANLQRQIVARSQIPLSGIYLTLGTDRAINLLGAGTTVGWPALVIDAGTALTFTAGIETAGIKTAGAMQAKRGQIYGGAILPGLRLQAQALDQKTADLTKAIKANSGRDVAQYVSTRPQLEAVLPNRWAMNTSEAIASGIAYGTLSTITDYLADWWQLFPGSSVVFTGGDGPQLHAWLKQRTPEIASRVRVDSYLMFWGMHTYRSLLTLAL